MTSNQDISFLESFALGDDRKNVLKTLVPGTLDHFIYLCLLAEQTNYPADLQTQIDEYIKNHGEHDQYVRQYRTRKQFVTFAPENNSSNSKENNETVTMLRNHLGLTTNYSRPHDAPPPVTSSATETPSSVAASKPLYPSAIPAVDQAKMTETSIVTHMIKTYNQNFMSYLNMQSNVYEHPAVLAALNDANDEVLCNVLLSISGTKPLPESDTVIDLLAKAMKSKYATDRNLDSSLLTNYLNRMTLPQIEALGDRVKDLVTKEAYVAQSLARMSPPPLADFRTDRKAYLDYLDRIWTYVNNLPGTYNSLKLVVLYHQLYAIQSDPQGDGKLNSNEARTLLEKYLSLPRQEFNDAPSFKANRDAYYQNNHWAYPGSGGMCINAVALPPVDYNQDRKLYTAALTDIFAASPNDSLAPWDKYVPETRLKQIQALAKLQYGPDSVREKAADWARKLPGGMDELKRVSDEVLLKFTEQCNSYLGLNDSVTLHITAKKVPRITVSLYEINTTSYYRENGNEITSDIQLDGLTPFSLVTHDFAPNGDSSRLDPLVIHSVRIPLPAIDTSSSPCGGRGVWIAEVVGAGRSIRAVIRRGCLRFIERRTIAGHVLTVTDENNVPLPRERVALYMSGRRYVPEPATTDNSTKAPEILIPYGSRTTNQQIILTFASGNGNGSNALSNVSSSSSSVVGVDNEWSFSTLQKFVHSEESYNLQAAFAVERESIVRDNYNATVLVRPRLILSATGLPVPLKAFEHATLTIDATDGEGATSQRITRNFPLSYEGESAVPFAVPPNVRNLRFTLSGEVEVIATGSKQSLSISKDVNVNGIDYSDETKDVFLRYTNDNGFLVYVLGKTGEPIENVPLTVDLYHSLVSPNVGAPHANTVPFRFNLSTDTNGAITLGPLKGYTTIRVQGPWGNGGGNRTAAFDIPQDSFSYPTTIHTVTGTETVPNAVANATVTASSSSRSWTSLLGGSRAPSLASLAVPAPADDVVVQARLPFRPSAPSNEYVLTRQDFKLIEIRPNPNGGNSAQWTGNGTFSDSAYYGGNGVPVADYFNHAKYDSSTGFITVRGLPAGQYLAQVKRPYPFATAPSPEIVIRVLPASTTKVVNGRFVSGNIVLQTRQGVTTATAAAASSPVHIASVTVDHNQSALIVQVTGGSGSYGGPALSGDVRVHITSTHFVPVWNNAAILGSLPIPGLDANRSDPVRSRYLETARKLGEEILYVLDRQERIRTNGNLPGNLLPRPSLLLNPWSLGPVKTDTQEAASGTAHASVADSSYNAGFAGRSALFAQPGFGGAEAGDHASYISLDYLNRPAAVLANLRPDPATGLIVIPLANLFTKPLSGNGNDSATNAGSSIASTLNSDEIFLTIVAADNTTTASTTGSFASLPAAKRTPSTVYPPPFRDLTKAASALDASSHLVQRSRTSLLARPGDKVSMAAAASYTKAENYLSLERAAGLLATLSNSVALRAEWLPLLAWPSFTEKEKMARYSKWASHEFHMFVFMRDGNFFNTVIAPYLSSKRSKTFLDHWFLGASANPTGPADQPAAAHWKSLRAYSQPHVFNRLNPFEQALLAAALTPDEAAGIAQSLRDWAEANPVSSEIRTRIFRAALASNALEASGAELEQLLAATESERTQAKEAAVTNRAVARPVAVESSRRMLKSSMPAPAPPMMAMMAAPSMAKSMPMARRAAANMAPVSMSMPMMDAMPIMTMAMEADQSMMMDSVLEDTFTSFNNEMDTDMALRDAARANTGFKPLDKTEEYAETHYYRIRKGREEDIQNLVTPSAFWADFATHVASVVAEVFATLSVTDQSNPVVHAAAVAKALRSRPFVSAYFPLTAINGGSGANGQLNAMLLSLGVMGLPLERSTDYPPERPQVSLTEDATKLTYTAGKTSSILFHQDIATVSAPTDSTVRIVAGQQYLDPSDSVAYVNGVQTIKFLPSAPDGAVELQAGKVYYVHVVVSNISPAQQELEVLNVIPGGSLPALNGSMVSTRSMTLAAYSTQEFRYPFYMPRYGTYQHFPVHISSIEGELVAFTKPVTLRVVARPTVRDTTSWRYIAANSTDTELVQYLRTANSQRTDLTEILWRLQKSFTLFETVLKVLRTRQWWHTGVWGLSFGHNYVTGMKEYLTREPIVRSLRGILGNTPVLFSPLLTINGEEGVGSNGADAADSGVIYNRIGFGFGDNPDCGAAYEHLEYSPLVNARAHQLGVRRRILNKAVERQYRSLLHVLAAKPVTAVSAADLLAVTYHLLLQDRIDEATKYFAKVPVPNDSIVKAVNSTAGWNGTVAPAITAYHGTSTAATSASWSTMQYDYMAAYLDFYRADGNYRLPVASAVAKAYRNHPVPKWAAKFREIAAQLEEAGITVDGGAGSNGTDRVSLPNGTLANRDNASEMDVSKEMTREANQSAAVKREPSLEFTLEGTSMVITYSNLNNSSGADNSSTNVPVTVRFFTMDLELLFSTAPFMTFSNATGTPGSNATGGRPAPSPSAGVSGMFQYVRPNGVYNYSLPSLPLGRLGEARFPLPTEFVHANVMVEVATNGLRRSQPYYATSLNVTIADGFGRLRVTDSTTGAPLPRTYVKVYYSESDAPVPLNSSTTGKFYKDGYTDVRGAFDYTALSTDELNRVKRFAILVSSESHGAVVRLASPPTVR